MSAQGAATLAAACLLAACAQQPTQRAIEPARPVAAPAAAPAAGPSPAAPQPPAPRFEAQGHQPRWTLRLQGQDEILFEAEDGLRFRTQVLFTPDASPGAAALGIEVQGHPALLAAERRLCRDALSAQPHPWQVSVSYRGRVYLGCGGRPAALLEGRPWRVEALDGAPALGAGLSSLQFDPAGQASAQTPCNRVMLRYDTRDGGLSLGLPAQTRQACADPQLQAQEAALLSFLPLVARFELAPDGALLLRAADGRRLRLAR